MWLLRVKRYQVENKKITDNYRRTLSGGDLLRCLRSEAVNEHVPLSETRLLSTDLLHQGWSLRERVKMDGPPDLLEYRADIILRLQIAKESNSKSREQLVRSCVLSPRWKRLKVSVYCSGLATRCRKTNS